MTKPAILCHCELSELSASRFRYCDFRGAKPILERPAQELRPKRFDPFRLAVCRDTWRYLACPGEAPHSAPHLHHILHHLTRRLAGMPTRALAGSGLRPLAPNAPT